MPKYRKKPVVIEARQFEKQESDHIASLESWCRGKYDFVDGHDVIKINTKEGTMMANVGDYIIKGVQGEFYPCKEDVFWQTYEPVEE